MFVKFRNRLTGSIMWVADDRAEEYRKLGHKEIVDSVPEKPIKEKPVEEPKAVKKAPAKKPTTAKTTAKKK